VSESILDHGYIAEEHAPDPIVGHGGDPTPPGKIAIWLFLASEVMFFIGILGSYIILRSGEPALFAEHGLVLSKPWAALNTLVLIGSSLTMALAVDAAQKNNRKRLTLMLGITLLCAFGFMVIKTIEYTD
jgi:cytochrome c oxidase subunit 3